MVAPDAVFEWHITPHVLEGDGWTGNVLEMTSQRWLPDVAPDVWCLCRKKTRVLNLGFLAVKRNTGAKSIEESKEPHPGGH